VVAVDVRDEEAPHVAEPGVELGEGGGEHVAGLRDGPARVDHGDLVAVADRVDVHSPQPVHRERQGDAVHVGSAAVHAGAGPVACAGQVVVLDHLATLR
jgi:hypothetical protein